MAGIKESAGRSMSRRDFIRVMGVGAFGLALTACAPELKPTQSFDPSKTPTPESSPTLNPTETATATATPTEDPRLIASELGLKDTPLYEDRTFVMDGDYFIDQYNNVPKAVRDGDGGWRRLDYTNEGDAEVMYGALVPEGGEYIDPVMLYDGSGPYGRTVATRFLGDWESEPVEFGGRTINVYHLIVGLRDGDGKLHIVRLLFDAPDLEPAHVSYVNCESSFDGDVGGLSPGQGSEEMAPVERMLPQLAPGEPMAIAVREKTRFPHLDYKDGFVKEIPEWNNTFYMLMTNLYSDHPGLYQLTAAERDGLGRMEWPDRTATLVPFPTVAIGRAPGDRCPR